MSKKIKSQYDNPKTWEKKIPLGGDAGTVKNPPQNKDKKNKK